LRQQSSKCFETAVQAAVSKANLDASDAFRGALADARAECFKQVEESRAREESTRQSALEEIQASRAREDLEHKALYDAAVEKAALAESVRRLEESRLREEAIRQSEVEERLAARRSLANANERTIDAVQHAHGQTLSFTLALQNGSAQLPQEPDAGKSSKEKKFRALLDEADCDDNFDELWSAGIKSALGVTKVSDKDLLDLGLSKHNISFLKDAAGAATASKD